LAKGKSLSTLADFNGDGVSNIRDAADIAHELASTSNPTAAEMLRLVNIERQKVGAAPLRLNATMNDMANVRAKELTVNFSHTRPDGRDCFSVFDDFSLGWSYIGENIAAGSSTVAGTMNQWINSPGHYGNIISGNFTELGVGCVYVPNSEYGYYWVQIFR
ncbi:MAG: CAP domain-containing protein, partial [Porcipelethomonas sp.]